MELDEFITQSLVQVCRGVRNANKTIAESIVKGCNNVFMLHEGNDNVSSAVEFDVAVTLKSDSTRGGT